MKVKPSCSNSRSRGKFPHSNKGSQGFPRRECGLRSEVWELPRLYTASAFLHNCEDQPFYRSLGLVFVLHFCNIFCPSTKGSQGFPRRECGLRSEVWELPRLYTASAFLHNCEDQPFYRSLGLVSVLHFCSRLCPKPTLSSLERTRSSWASLHVQ